MADYILLKNAEKFLVKLPINEQIRIIQALDNLINNYGYTCIASLFIYFKNIKFMIG